MKRPLEADSSICESEVDNRIKKGKMVEMKEGNSSMADELRNPRWNLSDDLLFEILKHADARSLAAAACVSHQWKKTALDERLWELICTRHWANIGCGNRQLRSVVLALGGFRRLHSQYLWPLTKPSQPASSSSSNSGTSSSWPAPIPKVGSRQPTRWGKDEVHLSLSLLSIKYYEKMNFSNKER